MSPTPSARVFAGIKHKLITATNNHRLLRFNRDRKLRRNSKVFVFICVYLLRLLLRFLREVDRRRPVLPGISRPGHDRLSSKAPIFVAPTTTTDTHVPAHKSS